jgi:hypothetical protein
VHRAAGAVALEVGEVEHLRHDALAGEGGVAVDQQRQDRVGARRSVDHVLHRPHHAFDHGVDGLEVRRVGGQLHGHDPTTAAGEGALGAEVVLHIARALHHVGVDVALELVEDLADRLAHHVGQHVEPAAVSHAEHGAVDPGVGRRFEHGHQQRHCRLGPFDAEALGADVLRGQEALERLGRVELLEDVVLVPGGEPDRHAFDVLLDPVLLVRLLDVHVLHAHGPAVGVAQDPQDLGEGEAIVAGQAVGEELTVEVPDGQTVGRRVELGVHRRDLQPQRVEVSDEVPAHPVC